MDSVYNPVSWSVRVGSMDRVKSQDEVKPKVHEHPAYSRLAEITGHCGPVVSEAVTANKKMTIAPVSCLSGAAVNIVTDGLPYDSSRICATSKKYTQNTIDTRLVVDPANSSRKDGGVGVPIRPMSAAARRHYNGSNVGSLMGV